MPFSSLPMIRRVVYVTAIPAILGSGAASAQSLDVGDAYEDYLRLLQISGDAPTSSFSLRPIVFREDFEASAPGSDPWADSFQLRDPSFSPGLHLTPLQARLRIWANSAYPSIQNDGAVWQGKGLTTAVEVGTTLRWRGLRLTMKPNFIYGQNSDFDLAPVEVAGQSMYGYPWRKIDLPQRFGPDARWRLDPGQSELRISGGGVTGGFGTRNIWWGPGIRSSIIMSNNAAGVPHAFLGTQGPRNVGIGTVEANWIWGRLAQSDYFDLPVETDDRFLTGLVLAYSPSFLDGLSLGFARVFYGAVPPAGLPLSDVFMVLQGVQKEGLADPDNPSGDDDKDQMLSFFGRWVLPESGFEVYAEWARNDHAWNFNDFLLEPEHSQAYTLGLQKSVELSRGNRLSLRGELTHLEREATFRVRASPVYYSHHIVTQGYTHQGQTIGAGIGPGGIQQHLGADLYTEWGRAGVMLQRRVHDNDAYYDWAAANDATSDRHDVSLDFGANGMVFVGDFEVGGAFTFTRQWNRYFFGDKVNNVNVHVSAAWRPGTQ